MTNRDMYKTVEERYNAFTRFCASHIHDCTECEVYQNKIGSAKKTNHNCKFAWLDLEAKIDENIVTNEKKYKDPEEQVKAFRKFCDKHNKRCSECPAGCFKCNSTSWSCDLVWLTLKADEEK